MASPRSTTPTHRVRPGLPILFFTIVAFSIAQPTMAQWYCNGRAAVTMPAAGCSGTSVCSPLMAAVTQTRNWWNGTNNTAGNSLGVASANYFTSTTYSPMLGYTNLNTYNGKDYSTACKKIAALVAQLQLWANKPQANWTMANATYGATAKQELYGTVIPGWGYTIGDYVACGTSCVNYTSTTSTTSTTTTPTTSTTGKPSSTTTTTVSPSSTTAVPPAGLLANTSALILGAGYFTNSLETVILETIAEFGDTIIAGAGCSTPYGEVRYVAGLNTPQSQYWPNASASPAVPAQLLANNIGSAAYRCNGAVYGTPNRATMCLCAPNGTCYQLNETRTISTLVFYMWCDEANGGDSDCVTYVGLCIGNDNSTFQDVATGATITSCGALAAGGPLQDCYAGSTNCSYPPVAYANCGPCPAPTLDLNCSGPIDAVCAGAPTFSVAHPLVLAMPEPGENFPSLLTGLNVTGTCNNCSSPNTTQFYYARNATIPFACMNGTNTNQVDWTGFCLCNIAGGCFRFRALPDGSATINSVMNVTLTNKYPNFFMSFICKTANTNVVLENESGGVVLACVPVLPVPSSYTIQSELALFGE